MAEANVDLLIGGSSLRAVSGLYVVSWDALLTEAPYRGSNITIPKTAGQTSYTKVRDAYVMDFPVALQASTKYGQIAILNAVRALCATNLVALTRRLPTDDAGTYADTTCDGEYLAATALDAVNWVTGRTTLSFVNLDGAWA